MAEYKYGDRVCVEAEVFRVDGGMVTVGIKHPAFAWLYDIQARESAIRPRTDAEPDGLLRLREACEAALAWFGNESRAPVAAALREALAAAPEPPPTHTCGECRWWCECGATVYGCTYPYYGDKHSQANWRACGFFQPYPKGGA